MLELSHFDHLRSDRRCKFKEEIVNGQKLTIVAYMVSDPDYWKIPLSEETRGAVFDENGRCISRPFEKFWNLGENNLVQEHNLPWEDGFRVADKIDGSMVTPVLVDNSIFFKTKKTFYNDISTAAQKLFATLPEVTQKMIRGFLESNITPIFEYTGPDNKIVIAYPQEHLWLLALRSNDTGEYLAFDKNELPGLKFPVEFHFSRSELQKMVKESTSIEGVVIRFSNGIRVKLKSPWYLALHRVLTDIRERDVAEAVVNENYDDIYAVFINEQPNLAPKLDEIRQRVQCWFADIYQEIDEVTSEIPVGTSPKDVAQKYNCHPLFDLIMAEFRGKDIVGMVNKRFIRHELPKYSLRAVGAA